MRNPVSPGIQKNYPTLRTNPSHFFTFRSSLATAAEQPAAASVAREIDWKEKEEKNSRDAGPGAVDEINLSGSKEEEEEEEVAASSVRRLKSATLDRMGRMLRLHSKSSGEKVCVWFWFSIGDGWFFFGGGLN